MEKYSHVKFICSAKKRFSELELAIQLRTEKISNLNFLKYLLL